MTISELENTEKSIQNLIAQQYKRDIDKGILNPKEIEPVADGIFNISEYHNAEYKILWILQEPYDSDGGGWHMSERVDKAIEEGKFSRDWRTWEKLVYVSWSILNYNKDNVLRYSLKRWEEMPDYGNHPEMLKILRKIAYANVKKLPNINSTNRNYEEIRNAYEQNREILRMQIIDYKPQIIIGGSTLNFFYQDLDISDNMIIKPEGKCVHYSIKDNKIFVDAYHPAYRGVARKNYCDDILFAVEEWMNQNRGK
jgi:hypothetical protein